MQERMKNSGHPAEGARAKSKAKAVEERKAVKEREAVKERKAVKEGKDVTTDSGGRILAREQKVKEIQGFTLFSNAFLSVVLEDIGACQYVLRVLTGNKDIALRTVKSQYTVLKIASHDAWLDVLAEDMQGRLYALELQQRNTVNHPRRVRFYESMIDSSFLLKGENYDKLPEVRMFYIGAGDFPGKGKIQLRVEKRFVEDGQKYEDGLWTTYINAGVEDGSEISRLMQYFKTADPEDMRYGELSERVHFLKKEEEGIRIMCEVTDKFWKWGYESGEEAGERRGMLEGERRGIRKGERRGIRKGERRGRRQGRRQGKQEQARQTACNLALMGMSAETIAKAVEVETAMVEQWLSEMGQS